MSMETENKINELIKMKMSKNKKTEDPHESDSVCNSGFLSYKRKIF